LLPVREHCRTVGEVILPDGERRAWRWYDPDVLLAILPTLWPASSTSCSASIQTIVIPAADAWTWLSHRAGAFSPPTRGR
jgi:hypothetical protein